MVLVAATTGLRRSELFALKWSDIDFSNLRIDVQRSIFLGNIGDCKTEASRQAIPSMSVLQQISGFGRNSESIPNLMTGFSRAVELRGGGHFGRASSWRR